MRWLIVVSSLMISTANAVPSKCFTKEESPNLVPELRHCSADQLMTQSQKKLEEIEQQIELYNLLNEQVEQLMNKEETGDFK